jgi:hypothetical protein
MQEDHTLELPVLYSKHFSDNEIDLIMDGDMSLFVWGRIIYKDGFGDGNETEFAFRHSNDGRWLVSAPSAGSY